MTWLILYFMIGILLGCKLLIEFDLIGRIGKVEFIMSILLCYLWPFFVLGILIERIYTSKYALTITLGLAFGWLVGFFVDYMVG